MKTKRIAAVLTASLMALSLMAGCTNNNSGDNSSDNPSSNPASENTNSAATSVESGKLSEIHEAVKAVYGEYYTPSMAVDETMLSEAYGISSDMVKEVVAEIPMISIHVDTFIGVEAAEGQADAVEKALQAYRDKNDSDEGQYPMNRQKVKAATVYRVGDYVFFIMLSGEGDVAEQSDEEQLEFYRSENQKAIDAIDSILKK